MTLGLQLAEWAAGLRYEDLPATVVADCRLRLLDTLGVALAAVPLPIGRAVRKAGHALGGGDEATILGEGTRSSAANAALVNGTLAHAMDFDDTHNESVMHPSAPTVAAALAAAEAVRADGRELLVAIAIGNELGCRLGLITPGAFHGVGLHPTSVLGAPAATAAVARLWRQPAGEIAAAFGISASQASGVLEAYADGTWSKTLHPGWAAHAAIVAARLAQAGFTGPATAFEGRYGLYRALLPAGTKLDLDAGTNSLGREWVSLATAFKLYPNAHAIHAFIEGVLQLRTLHGLTADRIRAVALAVPEEFIGQIAEPRAAKLAPRTSTHARASLFYAVAAALVDGTVTAAHYEGDEFRRPDLLAMAERVTAHVVPAGGKIQFSGGVSVELHDGATVTTYIAEADGTGSRGLSESRVIEKFAATAGSVLAASARDRLVDLVLSVERLGDIGKLMAATAITEAAR
ncbi:MAG: MmgE/PrpD family protein [Proteobacteria bacterium]|nr:MmgE/PrpD family protein [Pseudomonadota bacterium]